MARERLNSSQQRNAPSADIDFSKSFYLATPWSRITAAIAPDSSSTKLKLGTGEAYLFKRKHDPAALTFAQNNTGSSTYLELEKVTKEHSTDQFKVRVYNPFMHEINADGTTANIDYSSIILFVQQDAYGDYYIVGEADQPLIPAVSTGALSPGSFCMCNLLTRAGSAAAPFSTISRVVKVHDAMMNTGESAIAANTKMWIKRIFGKWYMVVPMCSTTTTPVTPPPAPAPEPPPPAAAPPTTTGPVGGPVGFEPWLGPPMTAYRRPMEEISPPPIPPISLPPCSYYSVDLGGGLFGWTLDPASEDCPEAAPCAPPVGAPTGLGQTGTGACGEIEGEGP
jgi:hypothetical protein